MGNGIRELRELREWLEIPDELFLFSHLLDIHFGANVIAQGVLRSFFELGDIVRFEPAASDFFDELFELAFVGIENDAFGFDSE